MAHAKRSKAQPCKDTFLYGKSLAGLFYASKEIIPLKILQHSKKAVHLPRFFATHVCEKAISYFSKQQIQMNNHRTDRLKE
ncbi:MAG: hypothetical protein IJV06_11660 [Bacteroidaceae bacterium]|nr:hypothetical protein [Bacteroidaceae bacterium]